METDIVAITRALLHKASEPLTEIAEGSDVSYRWLLDFKAGRVDNPTMRTIRGLHSYLTKDAQHSAQPN